MSLHEHVFCTTCGQVTDHIQGACVACADRGVEAQKPKIEEALKEMKMSKWIPTTDLLLLRRLGKTGEEFNELGSVTNRCITQGIDGTDMIKALVPIPDTEMSMEELEEALKSAGADYELLQDDYKQLLIDLKRSRQEAKALKEMSEQETKTSEKTLALSKEDSVPLGLRNKLQILSREIELIERRIDDLSECELCDGEIKETAICLKCWNETAPKVSILEQRNAELEEENFALAAGACCVSSENGGLIGDDSGNVICQLDQWTKLHEERLKKYVQLKQENQRLREDNDRLRRELDD